MNRYLRGASFFASILLCTTIGLIFLPLSIHEDHTEAATGSASESTMSLDINNATASVDLTVNSSDGTFATSSSDSQASFSITTNHYSGYSLSISAPDDSGKLNNDENYLDSISSAIDANTFDSSSYNNKWGYLPNKVNSSPNTNYLPSPTTQTTTLDVTNSANPTANTYTIALGARADFNTPTGTYSKTIIINSVGNPINYVVNFNKNTTDDVTNLPSTQSASTTSTHIELSDLVPVRANYDFAGWCLGTATESNITTESGVDTCSTTVFNPNGSGKDLDYGIDQTTLNTATLYAMWELTPIDMQLLSINSCTTDGIRVRDIRDGEVYFAKKLADNKCWMLDNLRLNIVSASYEDLLGNTNASETALYYLKNGGGSGQYANAATSEWIENYSYTEPWISTTHIDDPVTSFGTESGKVGVYYNYCAASAGSYCYGNGEGTGDAEFDVCPAGWRMPKGGNSTIGGEYNALCSAVKGSSCDTQYDYEPISMDGNNPSSVQYILSVPLAGYFGHNKPQKQGEYGRFWTTTTQDPNSIYGLISYPDSIYTQWSNNRNNGNNIRCVLDTRTIADAEYLQDVTPGMAKNTTRGTTATLKDKRDNESYVVGKLNDDHLWLLDNLRFDDATYTMSSNDTNIAPGTTYQFPNASWGYDNNVAYYNSSQKNTIAETTYGVGSNKTGTYYNYCATSAGTYCNDGGPSSNYRHAEHDICPANWRLPSGTSGNLTETGNLYSKYNNLNSFKTAFSGPIIGYSSSSGPASVGSWVYYWTSTAQNNNIGMYAYYYGSSSSGLQAGTFYRRAGYSIRCTFKMMEKYTLNFNANTTDTVTNIPSPIVSSDNRGYHYETISADEIPQREGYTFAGWAYSNTATIPSLKYENGTFTPQEILYYAKDYSVHAVWWQPYEITFTFDSNVENVKIIDANNVTVATISNSGENVILNYPQKYTLQPTFVTGSVLNSYSITSGAGSLDGNKFTMGQGTTTINITSMPVPEMQSWNNCKNLGIGETTLAIDNRDNDTYTIGKLADNKCWMLENLRLSDSTVTLTSANSNIASGATYQLPSTSGWTTADMTTPMLESSNKDAVATTKYGTASGKRGVYYNYCALSAGTYCYTSGAGTIMSSYDICPAGWRLPTGDIGGEIDRLYKSYNSNLSNTRSALSVPLSGYYNNATYYNLGTASYFMTASPASNNYAMMDFYFSSNAIGTTNNWLSRASGGSARCILRDDAQNITFTYDDKITNLTIKRPDGEIIGTVATSGNSLQLEPNFSYLVEATMADSNYILSSLTVTSGTATATGISFTTSDSTATIHVTSETLQDLQNWSGCPSMNNGSIKYLKDNRDNDVYLIGKLDDDRCWILENLRLSDTSITLDNTNTNLPAGTTFQLPNTSGSWTTNDITVPMIEATEKNTIATARYGTAPGKRGVYYNYCAASAGTYCYPSGANLFSSSYDLCPAGWRLPTGGIGGEPDALYQAYSSSLPDSRTALSIALSGYYTPPSYTSIGNSYHWTSTAATNAYSMLNMQFGSNNINVTTTWSGRAGGNSIRCINKNEKQPISFTFDEYITKITVTKGQNETVGTINSSGDSLMLESSIRYTIVPTFASGYTINEYSITNGAGTIQGNVYYPGYGSATVNIASTPILYAENWNKCNKLGLGEITQVKDSRDNNIYNVSRLTDEQCWFIDNLRLDLTNSTVVNALNSTNTNASNTALNYLKNGGGTASNQYAITGLSRSNWTSSYSYSAPLVAISGICTNTQCVNNPENGKWNKDSIVTTYGNGSGKIGIYYNYCAASAGTYCWGNDTSYSGTPESDPNPDSLYDIEGDICPAGWHLPTTTTNGDYYALSLTYSGNYNIIKSMFSSTLQGNYYVTGAYAHNYSGGYWTSTYNNSAYDGFINYNNTSYLNYTANGGRSYGYSIRCVFGGV